jgi:nucleotide-binding universal stress UspA family protein
MLVALDGSVRAPGVFVAALEIAERFGASVQPFRAIFVPPEFPAAAAGSAKDPLPELLERGARAEVSAIVSGATLGSVHVEPAIVRIGDPWRAILEVSDEVDADLIVVGSHGYHGLDRLLGTTAARVANMATRNVLVVHERADDAGPVAAHGAPYRGGTR